MSFFIDYIFKVKVNYIFLKCNNSDFFVFLFKGKRMINEFIYFVLFFGGLGGFFIVRVIRVRFLGWLVVICFY